MPLFSSRKTIKRDRPRRKPWWDQRTSGLSFLSAYIPGPRISGLWYNVRTKVLSRATTPEDSHGIPEAELTADQEHEAQDRLAREWHRDE
jgi:hypothetical protein